MTDATEPKPLKVYIRKPGKDDESRRLGFMLDGFDQREMLDLGLAIDGNYVMWAVAPVSVDEKPSYAGIFCPDPSRTLPEALAREQMAFIEWATARGIAVLFL